MKYIYLSVLLCLTCFNFTFAQQPGSLDPTFGFNGIMIASLGNNFMAINAYSVLQPDGKIIVGGTADTAYNKRPFVMRFNADGSRDFTFGGGATITKATAAQRDTIYGIALQNDGKIVLAGVSWSVTSYRVLLLRYNSDGTIDNTFGTSGIKIITPNSGGEAHSVAIQDDQKIVVAGYTVKSGKQRFLTMRLNSNGTFDNTFGTGGIVATAVDTIVDYAYTVAIQPDQKILVGGYSAYKDNGWLGKYIQFATVRYNTNGTPDASFGNAGMVKTKVGTVQGYSILMSIAVTDSQKILAGGQCQNFSSPDRDFAVVCYNSNGSKDSSFAEEGIAYTDFANHTDNFSGLAIKPDGNFVTGGYSFNNSGLLRNFALAQYLPDGNPDVYFGSIGKVTNNLGQYNDIAYSVMVQPDGKIILTGTSDYASNVVVGLARYIGTAQPSGISTPKDDLQIQLYPNPANTQLFIETSGAEVEQVNIYNSTGSLVKAAASITNHQLSIENLAAGLYIAEIKTKERSTRKRWVKM